MKRKILLLFSFLIHISGFSQQDYVPQPKIWAVVVGVADYKDPKIPDLKYAEKDAQAYYQFLKSPAGGALQDENVVLLTGTKATRANIVRAVNEKYIRAGEQDMIIFYFSGHGMSGELKNNGYLLSWDTEFENEAGTAVEMDDIKKRLDNSRAKVKMNFIDACHAGLFQTFNTKGDLLESNRQITEALYNGIANAESGNISFLASSSREQSLEDDKLNSGVFSYFLLKGLSGMADLSQPNTKGYKDGIISIGELNTYVTDAVRKQTNFKQNPSIAGSEFDKDFPLAILDIKNSLTETMSLRTIGKSDKVSETKNNSKNTTSDESKTVSTNGADASKYDPQAKAYGAVEVGLKTLACKTGNQWFGHYCFINRTRKKLLIYQISGGQKTYTIPIVLSTDQKICSHKLLVSLKSSVDNPNTPFAEDAEYQFKIQTVPEKEGDPVYYSTIQLTVTACREKTIELSDSNLYFSLKKY